MILVCFSEHPDVSSPALSVCWWCRSLSDLQQSDLFSLQTTDWLTLSTLGPQTSRGSLRASALTYVRFRIDRLVFTEVDEDRLGGGASALIDEPASGGNQGTFIWSWVGPAGCRRALMVQGRDRAVGLQMKTQEQPTPCLNKRLWETLG